MDVDKIKHLDYIQSTTSRMADNCFKIKGVCITIVSAFLGLFIKFNEPKMLLITCIPIITFWMLDSYYLQQERKFRCLYNNLTGNETSCKLSDVSAFSMSLDRIKGHEFEFCSVAFSKTELVIYASLIVCHIVLYFIL